jgi:hypothetical protein
LDGAHSKVDGKDDGHADNGDDEHKDGQMTLELDILQCVASTFPEQ